MKIYRNKLYSIQDAAKRAGVTEDQIKEMITYHVIVAHYFFSNVRSIWGEDIPGLKKKWEEYQRIKNIGKGKKKKALKNTPVTMLRMDKGD